MIGPDAAVLETALLAVPGVLGAEVLPDATGGAATLRLALSADADESGVATAVAELLERDHGLQVDSGVRLAAETTQLPGRHARPGPAADDVLAVEGRLAAVRPPYLSVVRDVSDVAGTTPWEPTHALPEPPTVAEPPPMPEPVVATLPGEASWFGGGPTEPPPPPPPPAAPTTVGRLRIVRLQVTTVGGRVTAEVELAGATTAGGVGQSGVGPLGTARAAAVATAAAVAAMTGAGVTVEAVTTNDARLLVDVAVADRDGSQALHGVADLGPDPAMSAVRAVLHAVNRRVEPLLH